MYAAFGHSVPPNHGMELTAQKRHKLNHYALKVHRLLLD